MSKPAIILFNPRSANAKPRIPNSILSVAASVHPAYEVILVDGNLEKDPLPKITRYIKERPVKYLGITVMPGPQLKQAVPVSKKVRELFPEVTIIWGGYFPSNHPQAVLHSGFVDFIVNGPGDKLFPNLIYALEHKEDHSSLHNLIFRSGDEIRVNPKDALYHPDELPSFPYDLLDKFYPVQLYLGKTFLGKQTIAYHSSFGCPFTCSFCAVVPIYLARWKGKSAENIFKDIQYIRQQWGGDAIEFHDNNFFVSESRTVEFSKLMLGQQVQWWGEGRIDTIDKYKDQSLALMREAGCRMIFFGAETGDDEMLQKMDKGGTQTRKQIMEFARRMKKFDIIPEYSFVLGWPGESEKSVLESIRREIDFIREIKDINPETEIIIYIYSPVPTEGSEMFKEVEASGFRFPRTLEEWVSPAWENFDLRKNPLTPWLSASHIHAVKNFETVLNGYYPTCSDFRVKGWKKGLMRGISSLRYKGKFYGFPYEIKLMQKLMKYRQPEITGFYQENEA